MKTTGIYSLLILLLHMVSAHDVKNDHLLHLDASALDTPLGEPIDQWGGTVGNGMDVYPPTPDAAPVLKVLPGTAHKLVWFDGVDDRLVSPQLTDGNGGTVIIVFAHDHDGRNKPGGALWSINGNKHQAFAPMDLNHNMSINGRYWNDRFAESPYKRGELTIASTVFDSKRHSEDHFSNGKKHKWKRLLPLNIRKLHFGGNSLGNFRGGIAEVMVFSKALNDTERTRWEAALATKWMRPHSLVQKPILVPYPSGECVVAPGVLTWIDGIKPSEQVQYTLIKAPRYGSVKRADVTVNVGETWTQADINSMMIKYVHSDSSQRADSFTVSVNNQKAVELDITVHPIINLPKSSSVSPVSFTGRAIGLESVSISNGGRSQPVRRVGNTFIGEIGLKAQAATDITLNLNNGKPQALKRSIRWTPTRIAGQRLVIRVGAGLLFECKATSDTIVLNVNGPEAMRRDIKPGTSTALIFGLPGHYTILDNQGRGMHVDVVAVDSLDMIKASRGRRRMTQVMVRGTLPENILFESEDPEGMDVFAKDCNGQRVSLIVRTKRWAVQHLIIRLKESNAILAVIPVKMATYLNMNESSVSMIENRKDEGYTILAGRIICDPESDDLHLFFFLHGKNEWIEDGNQWGINPLKYTDGASGRRLPYSGTAHRRWFPHDTIIYQRGEEVR